MGLQTSSVLLSGLCCSQFSHHHSHLIETLVEGLSSSDRVWSFRLLCGPKPSLGPIVLLILPFELLLPFGVSVVCIGFESSCLLSG